MKTNRIKVLAIGAFASAAIAFFSFSSNVAVSVKAGDVADDYKAKCQMCHTATASKWFDAAKTDAELTEIVLKGKKSEGKPPMPGYEAKEMTAEQATALVTHMRALKTAAPK